MAALLGCIVAGSALADDFSQPGPFLVGTSTVTIKRSDGSTFNAALFYPATSSGASTPFDDSGGTYPVVSFAHGLGQDPVQYYSSTMTHLASEGYFVIAPESYTSLLDTGDSAQLGADLDTSYQYLLSQDNSASSAFYQHVDTSGYAAMGHSMGGDASILDAASSSAVKTIVGLAAADISNALPTTLPAIHVPVQLLAGTKDGFVDASTTAQNYAASNAPAQLRDILGGFHFGFEDQNYIISDSGSITRAQQLALTWQMTTAWLNLYMKGDQSAWQDVWGPAAQSLAGVNNSLNPGITVSTTSTHLSGSAGTTVDYPMTVTNNGGAATSYSLFVEQNSWSTLPSILQTPVLNPGQSATFDIDVQVPAGLGFGQTDSVLVSARNDADNATRGYVVLQTAVVPEPSTLFLFAAGGLILLAWRRRSGNK